MPCLLPPQGSLTSPPTGHSDPPPLMPSLVPLDAFRLSSTTLTAAAGPHPSGRISQAMIQLAGRPSTSPAEQGSPGPLLLPGGPLLMPPSGQVHPLKGSCPGAQGCAPGLLLEMS